MNSGRCVYKNRAGVSSEDKMSFSLMSFSLLGELVLLSAEVIAEMFKNIPLPWNLQLVNKKMLILVCDTSLSMTVSVRLGESCDVDLKIERVHCLKRKLCCSSCLTATATNFTRSKFRRVGTRGSSLFHLHMQGGIPEKNEPPKCLGITFPRST